MLATDFSFNGHLASEYGLIICGFDGDTMSVSGGEIEVTTVQTPQSISYNIFGRTYPNVIQWNFSVCKNPCTLNGADYYFTVDEQRHINRWLMGESGYKEFFIINNDETIYYKCTANVTPRKVALGVGGFDIVITANSSFGYSNKIVNTFDLSDFQHNNVQIQVNNDIDVKIKPIITLTHIDNGRSDTITLVCTGKDLYYNSKNNYDTYTVDIRNASNRTIVIDSEYEMVDGLGVASDFNYQFPYLRNGINNFTVPAANVVMKLEYREIRKAVVQ